MTRFGDKVRLLRTYHRLTLSQLAVLLGYQTHSYLTEIELGKKHPTALLVLKIVLLFRVTTDELLRDELEIDLNRSIMDSVNESASST